MIYKTIFIISATVLPIVIEYLMKYKHRNKLKKIKNLSNGQDHNNYYYHCIFWTLENEMCKDHMYNNTECGDNCSVVYLKTIVKLLASAKYSIDMCMYHLTLKQVTDELINARKRGVNVRIISDNTTSRMEHSKIKILLDNYGFDVRGPPYEDSFMHHKYCVIDAQDPNLKKMFFGSLNLTLQGSVANFEFIVITNNSEIIQFYSNEFGLLWGDFDEIKRVSS